MNWLLNRKRALDHLVKGADNTEYMNLPIRKAMVTGSELLGQS